MDTERCVETDSACIPLDCGATADADGDGHERIACGGDDCDDADGTRYPGNAEVCDPGSHDEDCDSSTYGLTDVDGDGYVSSECCNADSCGPDCDDSRADISPGLREECNGVDDDCDAITDEASAYCPVGACVSRRCRSISWERTYGSITSDRADAVDVDWEGNVYVSANFPGDADLDDNPLNAPHRGYHMLSLSPSGRTRWTVPSASGITAVSPSGELIVLASDVTIQILATEDGSVMSDFAVLAPDGWQGPRIIDCTWVGANLLLGISVSRPDTSGTLVEAFQLRIVDTSGAIVRQRLVESSDAVRLLGTDADSGRVAVVGHSANTLAIDGDSIPSGWFVSVFDQEFNGIRHLPTMQGGAPLVRDVRISSAGDVALVGSYGGSVESFGETWPTSVDLDAFAITIAADGTHRWTRLHSGPGQDIFRAVDFDERGGVMISGQFSGVLDVRPFGRYEVGPAEGSRDAFIGSFDVEDSWPLDVRRITGPGDETIAAGAVDRFGALLIVGSYSDRVELLRGSYPSIGSGDVFVLRLSD